MDLRAYAAHRKERGLRGGSHVAVLKAIQGGRLPLSSLMENGRWQIDPDLADQEWAANTRDTVGVALRSTHPVAPSLEAAQSTPAGSARTGQNKPPDLLHSESVKRAAEARMKVMDLQVREQQLIEAQKLEPIVFACYRQFHDAIQGLPPRISDAISAAIGGIGEEQRHAVRTILESECDRLTDDLAKSQINLKNV